MTKRTARSSRMGPVRRDSPGAQAESFRSPVASRVRLLVSIILVAVTLGVFVRATGFSFINYDDPDYFINNPQVQAGLTVRGLVWAFTTFHARNWHPLTWLSHMLDRSVFGESPAGPHAINVLLHALNALLVFLLWHNLTRNLWPSAFVAALFALHPLHVESVAWISERKDVLCAFFGLLTLLAYERFVRCSPEKSRKWYLIALGCFLLGLLSKPMIVTLPFLLLLLDVWPLKRFRFSNLRDIPAALLTEKVPFLLLSGASCILTFLAQRHGGAVQSIAAFPFSARVENALISYSSYLAKTFWPAGLALPYPPPQPSPALYVLFAAVLLVAVSLLAVVALRKDAPFLFVGWFWFLGTLVPVIGLVQVGVQSMADRYTYLPIMGLFVAVAWLADAAAAHRPVLNRLMPIGGVIVLAAATLFSTRQLGFWRDSETLFTHAATVTAHNAIACANLGNHFLAREKIDEAIRWYRRALQSVPEMEHFQGDWIVALGQGETSDPGVTRFKSALLANPGQAAACADVLNNLGNALARNGETNVAVNYYEAALKINPDHSLALHNLAFELAAQAEHDKAITLYEAALRARPDQTSTHSALAALLVASSRYDEAIPHFEAVLESDPHQEDAQNALATALLRAGRTDEAIRRFHELLKSNPDDPQTYENLAIALASVSRLPEAERHFRQALRLNPGLANTHFNYANVLAMQRRFEEAEEEYRLALQIDPNHAPAHCHLGILLAELGRREQAVDHLKKALVLQPTLQVARQHLERLAPSNSALQEK